MMDVLIDLIVLIISLYIHKIITLYTFKKYILQPKYMQF